MWGGLALEKNLREQNLEADGKWGGLKLGRRVTPPTPLFPRIDPSKISIQ